VDTVSTMKKGSFIQNGSLVNFTVEDVEYHSTPYGVFCSGFGSLVISETVKFSQLWEVQEAFEGETLAGLMEELHGMAQEQACEDADARASRFDDVRARRGY